MIDKDCGNLAPCPRARSQGFSLIELMIAVLIIGILAAIALPSYKSYVIRANRADAQSQLLNASGRLERWYATHDSYSGLVLTGAEAQSPASGTAIYILTLNGSTPSNYALKAAPVSTSVNASDGFLSIDSSGDRVWDRNNSRVIEADEHTWRKP